MHVNCIFFLATNNLGTQIVYVIGASSLRRAIDKAQLQSAKPFKVKTSQCPYNGFCLHPTPINSNKQLQNLLEKGLKGCKKSLSGTTLWTVFYPRKGVTAIGTAHPTSSSKLWSLLVNKPVPILQSRKWSPENSQKIVQASYNTISPHVCYPIRKHRRDGMSRLGTSRNVQWSAEGARKCVYPRFQNLVNLSSLRSRKFRWKN